MEFMLFSDRTMSNASKLLKYRLLTSFNNAKSFGKGEMLWGDLSTRIEHVPGETLAYVTENNTLVICEPSIFNGLLVDARPNEYLTITQYAEQENKSVARVRALCNEGRIAGAMKSGNQWFIPKTSQYPTDRRKQRHKLWGNYYTRNKFKGIEK